MTGLKINTELEQRVFASLRNSGGNADWQLIALAECVSTMDAAREHAQLCTDNNPLLIISKTQSAGRGRKGRSWEQARDGLYATLVFRISAAPRALSGYSLLVGHVIYDALKELGFESKLKWPNDVLAPDGRKLGGVLVEFESAPGAANILYTGIGLNLSGAPKSVPIAAALDEFGISTSAAEVAALIARALYERLPVFLERGFSHYRKEWLARASGLGSKISAEQAAGEEGAITGKFVDCTDDGHLVLEANGRRIEIVAGDINFIYS